MPHVLLDNASIGEIQQSCHERFRAECHLNSTDSEWMTEIANIKLQAIRQT